MNIQYLFIIFAFAGLSSTLVGTIRNSIAQENQTSIIVPTLDNLTTITENNNTLSNSSSVNETENSDDDGENV